MAKKSKKFLHYDAGKPMLAFLPAREVEDVARVFDYGAEKYARHNWKQGGEWSRLLSSALRHIFAFMIGEVHDKESGLPHLAHAACNLLMVAYFFNNGVGVNDLFEAPKKLTK